MSKDFNLDWQKGYEEGVALGLQRERERIIKLLEDEKLETSPNNPMAKYDRLVIECVKEQLIALIKEENK